MSTVLIIIFLVCLAVVLIGVLLDAGILVGWGMLGFVIDFLLFLFMISVSHAVYEEAKVYNSFITNNVIHVVYEDTRQVHKAALVSSDKAEFVNNIADCIVASYDLEDPFGHRFLRSYEMMLRNDERLTKNK